MELSNRPEVIQNLGVRFRFEPRAKHRGRPQEHKVLVEAQVIGSDDVIMAKRHTWSVAYLKVCTKSSYFFWEQHQCVNSLIHKHRQVRLYKILNGEPAMDSLHRIGDRLVSLIAPNYYRGREAMRLTERLFREANDYLVAFGVMSS